MLEEDEEQSLKVFLEQLWVWSVSDFIFLALAYEDGWLVLSLAESSSHLQYAVSVFIIAELARGAGDLATISTLTVHCQWEDETARETTIVCLLIIKNK